MEIKMRWKTFRGLILQMITVAVSGAVVYIYNPVATAYFTALFSVRELRMVTLPVSVASLFLWMPYLRAAKYGLVMIASAVVIWIMEKLMAKKFSIYWAALISSVLILVFEATDFSLHEQAQGWMLKLIPGGIALSVFVLSVIFYKALACLYPMDDKKVRTQTIFHNEEMVCVGILAGLVAYAFGQERFLDLPLANGFSYFAIAFAAYKYGAGMGGIVGGMCGLAFTIGTGNMELLGTMCFIGILAGTFRELGRLGTLAGICCGVAICGIVYRQDILTAPWLYALAGGSLLFLVMPSSLLYRYQKAEGSGEALRRCLQMKKEERLKMVASSFERLSKSFKKIPPKREEMSFTEVSRMVEEISSKVCVQCTRYEECWKHGKYEAFKETSELFKAAAKTGMVGPRDVNRQFFNRCKNVNELILEVNHLYERQRVNLLWHNRLVDSKYAVATQLQEVSGIIRDFSGESYDYLEFSLTKEEWIRKKLRSKRLQMRRMTVLKNRQGRLEITIIIKSLKGICVSTKDIEQVVGEALGKRIRAGRNSKIVIGDEYVTLNFLEDTNFQVLCGAAKSARGKNGISGDNFGFTNLSCGQVLMTLSDGMGYGKYAYTESETVVELLEELLESGFKNEVALKLVNLVMMINSDSNDTATADMGILDLYTGICQFVKMGAAPTFIKRGSWVEVIKSTSLPMGVLKQVDYEQTTKKIYDGDMIIMVSDGMIDGLRMNDKEQELSEMIRGIKTNNPKEFANELLRKVEKEKLNDVDDDRTVLVGAVFSKV